MDPRSRPVIIGAVIAGVVLVGIAAYVGLTYFAPKGSTTLDEALPAPAESLSALRGGPWQGADGFHFATGTVTLMEGPDGPFLRFEDYDARDGPDVYYYLTPDVHASTTEQVEGQGLRVLVPGGAGSGQATLRGTFNVPLPTDIDLSKYKGISTWCDRFNAHFGSAPLDPVA